MTDHGSNFGGTDPGFSGFESQDFTPLDGSPCVGSGGPLAAEALPPINQYLRHRRSSTRPGAGAPDIGAFEAAVIFGDAFESGATRWWSFSMP